MALLNIESIVSRECVSKLDISNDIKLIQLLNILFIVVTKEVSKFDKSKEVRAKQP